MAGHSSGSAAARRSTTAGSAVGSKWISVAIRTRPAAAETAGIGSNSAATQAIAKRRTIRAAPAQTGSSLPLARYAAAAQRGRQGLNRSEFAQPRLFMRAAARRTGRVRGATFFPLRRIAKPSAGGLLPPGGAAMHQLDEFLPLGR